MDGKGTQGGRESEAVEALKLRAESPLPLAAKRSTLALKSKIP